MATLFYFGSNLSRNLIDLIKLHKDAFLLLDDDNFLSSSWNHSSLGKFDASLLQELITDKKAFYLESKNVVPCSIRRANPITYDEELIERLCPTFGFSYCTHVTIASITGGTLRLSMSLSILSICSRISV